MFASFLPCELLACVRFFPDIDKGFSPLLLLLPALLAWEFPQQALKEERELDLYQSLTFTQDFLRSGS